MPIAHLYPFISFSVALSSRYLSLSRCLFLNKCSTQSAMKIMSCPPSFFCSSKKKGRRAPTVPSFASNSSCSSDQTTTPKSVLSPKPRHRARFSDEHYSYSYSDSTTGASTITEGEKTKVTRQELEVVLRRLHPEPPTDEEIAAMLAEVDRCGAKGQFSVEEIAALGLEFGRPASPELRETFAVFDGDGDGKISAEELRCLFATLGHEDCTLESCRRMIAVLDTDGDGFVCFEDFVHMMRGQM